MDNLANRFNRSLILVWAIGPFVAFITFRYLAIDFSTLLQLLSFVGVFLIIAFYKRENPIIFPKYLLFYLLFILYVFWSDLIRLEREFYNKYLFKNLLIGGFNFMFIIENITISKKYYLLVLKISKFVLVVAFIVIVIQQTVDANFFIISELNEVKEKYRSDNQNRLLSIYSWIGGISLGFSFVPIFLLIIEELNNRKKKIILWIIMGLVFALLSKARWVMLNTLLVFFIIFLGQKYKSTLFFKYLIVLPIFLFGALISLESIGINANSIVKERIFESDKKGLNQKTASSRILAFKAFNEFYWRNQVFGTGNIKYGMGGTGKQNYELRRFLGGRSSQIHVGYLSLFYMYGLVGGLLFLGFLFFLLKMLYLNAKITRVWSPFLGILGFALANLTLVIFSVYHMGLIIVLLANRYYIQRAYLEKDK